MFSAAFKITKMKKMLDSTEQVILFYISNCQRQQVP